MPEPAISADQLQQLIDLGARAGKAIMAVYEQADMGVETKDDKSPLTEADLAAHRLLIEGLGALTPQWPILSEESALPDYATRRGWQRYWLVDPLDGTKEFINRNGEFTVNVALIEDGVPVFGLVHVPPADTTYYGGRGLGAHKRVGGASQVIAIQPMDGRPTAAEPIVVVASRRHAVERVEALLDKVRQRAGPVTTKSVGSALKLCLVAEGAADLYPRLGPTSEWDTAAAQAVVEAAGGQVVDDQFRTLRYNQKNCILNPEFFVLGDPAYDWRTMLG